jgi:hypothetical protein
MIRYAADQLGMTRSPIKTLHLTGQNNAGDRYTWRRGYLGRIALDATGKLACFALP